MRLAFVVDTPRLNSLATREYVKRAVAACAEKAGVAMPEIVSIPAVPHDLPGSAVPNLALIRAERAGLMERIERASPDAVVSLGAAAMHALWTGPKMSTLKAEHGRMRWLDVCTDDMCVTRVPWTPTVAPYHVIQHSDLHRDFVNVVYKAITQRGPLPPTVIDTHVCRTLGDLRAALALLEGATVVGVDVETGGLSPRYDELMAVGIGAIYGQGAPSDETEGVAVIIPHEMLSDPEVRDTLYGEVWRTTRRSVGHNFKFDMQFMAPLIGWAPPEASIGDTLLLAHLLDERPFGMNRRARGSGLKDLVAQRYDHQYGFDFVDLYSDPTPEKIDAMHLYLAEDVVYTARLWHDLVADAGVEGSRVLATHDELLVPVSKVIARCEWVGAPIDRSWTEETVRLLELRIARRTLALKHTIGRLAITMVIDNILSATQIADVMYDEWGMTPDVRKHGRVVEDDRSTDRDHIQAAIAKYLRCGDPAKERQARWLRTLERLRRDEKLRTTYQKSLLDRLDTDDRVRASFLLHGAATGRISAREPAVQTIPAVKRIDSERYRPMRRAFAPAPGRAWVDVDYSQLELRVAAALSHDEAMIEVFRSGRDVHREIASAIFSKPPEEIHEAERFLAKAVSFGIVYGRTAKALAGGREMAYAEQKLGMRPWTEPMAEAFIQKFLRSYPDLQRWIADVSDTAPAAGFVESSFGRRRRFPMGPNSRSELRSIQRQAVNTPIQATASDLCLEAMVRIFATLPPGADVLFPVHDSICIECDVDQVAEVREVCVAAMERPFMGVPLTVDFKSGPSWADVK